MTHAFFKALLFLGAGSVIIAMHHEQDMRHMGGLRKYMPITYCTMRIGSLALRRHAAVRGLLLQGRDHRGGAACRSTGAGLRVFAYCGVFVTASTFRLLYLTFHGEERFRRRSYDGHDASRATTSSDDHGRHAVRRTSRPGW